MQLPTLSAAALALCATVAAATPDPARGERFFSTTHGREWSCSSCHTRRPTVEGRHANTGKTIAPLAPAANPQRFTDAAKTEKWFRRNCNDVLGRECSSEEKADVRAWLASLAP
jgi:cytochrome c peroxidase